MKSRAWAAPAGVALAAAAIAIGLPRLIGSERRPTAPPVRQVVRDQPAPSASSSESPPRWPDESAPPPPGPHDAALRSGAVRTSGAIDPGPGFRATLAALSSSSSYVAVVVAVGQKSYWSSLGPTTATNYRVERVVKGRLPAYVQAAEFGAHTNSFPNSEQAWMPRNEVAPEVGHRYVLFLSRALGDGRFETRDGSNSRFEVVDGVVHSIRERFPAVSRAIMISPTPLAEFLDQVRG